MVASDHKSTPSRSSITASSDVGSVSGLSNSSSTTNIKVIARFRPHNNDELAHGATTPIVEFLSEESCNVETRDFTGSFTFDRVFDMQSQQEDVFNYSFKQTVDDLMKGYNGTVFAYGQTGSGKSYTMMGPNNNIDNPESRGMIPRIVDRIFEMILNSSADIEYTVKVSYMEIYMERIRDLLNPTNDNLPIHEDKTRGVYVKGLVEEYVSSSDEVYDVMRQGSGVRAVASTNMNLESSRSHSIFVITVAQKNTVSGAQKVGQLSLVDLAGSEKVGKTGASGQTLEEAKKINKSLSALGMVINSLTDGKSTHIPYRDSKLTRILQESLGGNSRTSLIVNCSPSSFNDSETLSTLRFGVRAKNIKNKAKINTELSPLELRQLLQKCQRQLESRVVYSGKLEVEITAWRTGDPPPKDTWIPLGGPSTSSLSVDSIRKPSHSAPTPTASGLSTPTSGRHSRNASTVSVKSLTPSSLRKNSQIPTSTQQKRNSIAEASTLFAPTNSESTKPEQSSELLTPKLATVQPDDSEVTIIVDDSSSVGDKLNSSGDVDTIEEFMRRENELSDQISEKESVINEQEQLLISLRAQMATITQQNQQQLVQNQTQKKNSGELNKLNTELKLQIDNLNYEKKELTITADTLNEENKKLSQELQDVKRQLLEFELNSRNSSGTVGRSRKLTLTNSNVSNTNRETTVSSENPNESSVGESANENTSTASLLSSGSNAVELRTPVSTEPEEDSDSIKVTKVRSVASKTLDESEETESDDSLSAKALHEKKKQQKMNEILGQFYQPLSLDDSNRSMSRNVSRAVSIADIINRTENKETYDYLDSLLEQQNESFEDHIKASDESQDTKTKLQNLYEARLAASEETTHKLMLEVSRLKSENKAIQSRAVVEMKHESGNEDGSQETSEEVVPVSAIKEKEEQAAAAREQIETMQEHIAQYESLKASLMQDLQERCERVVELEISLDQAREQYNLAIRNSNNKQQQKKMTLLQRNLEQLTTIQRQLVEQNVTLKRDVAMAHKILDARNERIQSLESALRDSQNRLSQESEIFETKLTYLRDRLLEVKRGGPSAALSNGGASTTSSIPSLYPSRDQQNSSSHHVLGQPALFKSPPGSPTNSSSAIFPSATSYSSNRIVNYPDLSSTSPTRQNNTRSVSGGPNSKIVKPLRGGGAGSGNPTSIRGGNNGHTSNSGAQTPIRQKANELTRSATGLWTKLNSLVTNSGSNPSSPTRSPTRSLSPIRLYRGSDGKNETNTTEGGESEQGINDISTDDQEKDTKKTDEKADTESAHVSGISSS